MYLLDHIIDITKYNSKITSKKHSRSVSLFLD